MCSTYEGGVNHTRVKITRNVQVTGKATRRAYYEWTSIEMRAREDHSGRLPFQIDVLPIWKGGLTRQPKGRT